MTLNGKKYEPAKLGFADMSTLEDWGLNIDKIDEKPLKFLSAFVALTINSDIETAKKEIDAHLENGGTLNEISDELRKAIGSSGFFNKKNQSE